MTMQISETDLVSMANYIVQSNLSNVAEVAPYLNLDCKHCGKQFGNVTEATNGNFHLPHCPVHIAAKVIRLYTNAEICRTVKRQSQARNNLLAKPDMRIYATPTIFMDEIPETKTKLPVAPVAPVTIWQHTCEHCPLVTSQAVIFTNPYMHMSNCKYRIDKLKEVADHANPD